MVVVIESVSHAQGLFTRSPERSIEGVMTISSSEVKQYHLAGDAMN